MKPPIISIVGKKNSGKTTLIEKLIPKLKTRGYRVGTVKHDTHGFDIDHKGKDTWRHKQSGAEAVFISSPWKISLIQDVKTEWNLDDIAEKFFQNMDIVITEGYKRQNKPKVEIFRSKEHKAPLHSKTDNETLIAVMSDVPLDLGRPRFHIDDIDSLVELLESELGLTKK